MSDAYHGLNLEFNLPVEAVAAVDVDEPQLHAAIRQILQGADLEHLSRRMIRTQLETQFHTDLSAWKEKINELILRVIEEQQHGEEEEEEEADEPEPSDEENEDDDDDDDEPKKRAAKAKKTKAAPKKKAATKRQRGADGGSSSGGAFNMKLSLSPELAEVVGADMMARPQIVKALWEYIREHDLQDPQNKRVIRLDERLRNVFQRDTVTMFSVNKYVKRHVRKPEELPPGGWDDIHRDGLSSDEDDEEKAAKKKAAATKKKKKATKTDDDGDEKKPRRNPFNAELALSPELAAVVGADRLARPQIVKHIWEYIRAHDLQDPEDKRTILLDETLRRVFQRDTVTMFSINKYIKRHAMKPENLPPGGWDAVQRNGESSDEDESSKPKKRAKK
ncbi:hypothetical protein ATCC90586_001328 [Pythium insidiosum]|nr:hypothetical protein ATCC90586_001328 [Pythium insidiosum]